MNYEQLERKVKVLPAVSFRGLLFVKLRARWPKDAEPIKVADVQRAVGLPKNQFATRLLAGEEFIINPNKK